MAYPDGTTVIRYYPVERFTETWYSNGSLPIGLSLWVKRVNTGSLIGEVVTAVYPEDEYPDVATYREGPYGNTPFGWGALWAEYMNATSVPLPAPGEFAERAFIPLTPEGVLSPILPSDLPIDIHVGFKFADYAGGVVQVGIYLGGEYVELASFQHSGLHFQEQYVAPDGWEGLPAVNPDSYFYRDMGDGGQQAAFLLLDGDVPVNLFWTQIKQAVEV